MTCTANSMVKDAMRSVSVESTGAAPTDVSAAADLSRSLPRMRLVGESIYQKGSLSKSEEHTSELQSLMRISYAVFCLKKKKTKKRSIIKITKRQRRMKTNIK